MGGARFLVNEVPLYDRCVLCLLRIYCPAEKASDQGNSKARGITIPLIMPQRFGTRTRHFWTELHHLRPSYRDTSIIRNSLPLDPTIGLCIGPPWGGGLFLMSEVTLYHNPAGKAAVWV